MAFIACGITDIYTLRQKIAYIYLVIVPLLVVITAFAFHDLDPNIYVPIWILNGCLMIYFTRSLLNQQKLKVGNKVTGWQWSSVILITPWIFIAVIFGMGPPPNSVEEWVAQLKEQQFRFSILILAAILIPLGFAVLKEQLSGLSEKLLSTIGYTAIIIAAPLCLLSAMNWGAFMTDAFRGYVRSGTEKRPEWNHPIQMFLWWMSAVQVSLVYLATGAFAASLKKTGVFSRVSCNIYMSFSLAGLLLNLVGSVVDTGPFSYAGYFVSIPAIPYIMPYLFGVNLLRSKLSETNRLRTVGTGKHA